MVAFAIGNKTKRRVSMLTILLGLLFGSLVAAILAFARLAGPGWVVCWGLLAVMAVQVGVGLLLRRKVKAAMDAVQAVLMAGQKKLQAKVNQWQSRPPGSLKQAQSEMERDQRVFIEQALEVSTQLDRYVRWTLMLDRQVATLRMQLYFQVREFGKVDRLLPRCMFLDPMSAAMKLTRLHARDEMEEAAKFFRKQTRRLRYGQGAVLYSLYAWMLLQRKDVAGAHLVLVRACERMKDDTLLANRDALANNRPQQFSNAGLGEEWYALGLEQPKVKVQRQRHPGGGGRPF
jgi:ElaB/YqjD/DUF883 family membrane-anchored ribosome-binding protein